MFENLVSPSTLLLIAAFLLYLTLVKRLTAFSFVLGGLIFLEITHIVIQYYFLMLVAQDSGLKLGAVHWYLSFALTDFLYVYMVYMLVDKQRLCLDNASKAILSIVAVLGLIQIVRMIDRLVVDSTFIMTLYSKGIPFLNLTLSLIVLLVVVLSFFSARNTNH